MSDAEKNKQEAIKMASQIFQVVLKLATKTTAEQRYNICLEKFKSFTHAFPLVVAKMTNNLMYNKKAFELFLDKMQEDPGKGMEGIITNQANYAKFLYIEECKRVKRHWSSKIAQKIWEQEYKTMNGCIKAIKENEKSAERDMNTERKKHSSERKLEFLNWLDTETSSFNKREVDMKKLSFAFESKENKPRPSGGIIVKQSPVEMPETIATRVGQALEHRERVLAAEDKAGWIDNDILRQWTKKRKR